MAMETLELVVEQDAKLRSDAEPKTRRHELETVILGLLGVALVFSRSYYESFNIPGQTIVLVIFLSGLMGITRLPLPTHIGSRRIPVFAYPFVLGLVSGLMDSFLVLILLGAATLAGSDENKLSFKAYCVIGALIGGLVTYFGEVYFLPLGLTYGMHHWYSMLPIVPPVLVFLGYLSYRCSKLDLQVQGRGKGYQAPELAHGTLRTVGGHSIDYIEFIGFIVLLLVTHNGLLCLGVLLAYASATGQGKQLAHVVTAEMEIAVMALLALAAFINGTAASLIALFSGWLAIFPSIGNAVLTGALYPASGNVWQDTLILSTGALILPTSSLVGVMVFKTRKEWWHYIKVAFPAAIVWFLIFGVWVYGVWPHLEPAYAKVFDTPVLEAARSKPAHAGGLAL